MEFSNKTVILTTTQGKFIQYKEQSDLAFKLLVMSQMQNRCLDLDELMTYCLAPVPHCLGTPDGFFAKTNKASMLHFVTEDSREEVSCPKNAMFIQDGNALFHALIDLHPTFRGICLQIIDMMCPMQNFISSTDSYKENSIKSQERQRRGTSEPFVLEGPSTRRPKDFKVFLMNDSNKKKLCNLLLNVWSSDQAVTRLEKCETAILIVDDTTHLLKSADGQVILST